MQRRASLKSPPRAERVTPCWCASTGQGSAVGGAWKVLPSSLPAGTCGQEQRRRSEEARDKWWGIPSLQEGLLVSTEPAGGEDPGATRSHGTSDLLLWLGGGGQAASWVLGRWVT